MHDFFLLTSKLPYGFSVTFSCQCSIRSSMISAIQMEQLTTTTQFLNIHHMHVTNNDPLTQIKTARYYFESLFYITVLKKKPFKVDMKHLKYKVLTLI